jgi:hypothetical protein
MLMLAPNGGDTFTGKSGFGYTAPDNVTPVTIGDSDIRQALQRNWSEILPQFPNGIAALTGLPAGLSGVVDDSSTLYSFLAQAGSAPAYAFITTSFALARALTAGSNICLIFLGGKIKPAAGITFTHNGSYLAAANQCWDCSAAGAVVNGTLRPIGFGGRLLTEHWGALGDGVTIDTVAFTLTAKAAADAGNIGIQLLAKTYVTDAQTFARGYTGQSFEQPSWFGVNCRQTIWSYAAIASGAPALKFHGGSGQLSHAVAQDIQFAGNSTSIGVMFSGIGGVRAIRCKFGANAEGIEWHNEDTGSFTEYDVADNCEFTPACILKGRYKVTAGNNSFHGSGFLNRCTANHSGGTVIQIDSGANVYNAPLDLQVWASATCTIVASAATVPKANFYGELTLEIASGIMTLASGNPVYFCGLVNATGVTTTTGANLLGGTFARVKTVCIHGDSSSSVTGFEKSYFTAMTTGANLIDSVLGTNNRFVNLRFEGANYDYRYVVDVDHDGSGGAGYVTAPGTNAAPTPYKALNTAGYGAPTFSVNTNGDLIATNAGWPASGVSCYWFEMSLSPGAHGSSRQQF